MCSTCCSRLIATVTHDLATPPSVLNAIVHLAKSRGVAEMDWAQLLNKLDTAGARATSLVRMLSDDQDLEGECLGLALSTSSSVCRWSPSQLIRRNRREARS
jgi:hypothetical protein